MKQTRNRIVLLVVTWWIGMSTVLAQPAPQPTPDVTQPTPAKKPPQPTAPKEAPVAEEPAAAPAEASGLVEARDLEDSSGRKVARVALLPIRGVWYVLWAPIRFVAWAYDRFAIQSRARRFFFSEDGKLGLFPTVVYKSGFGFGGGIRFVWRDLVAPKSRLKLEASYGGDVFQAYKAKFRTGELFGKRSQGELVAGFETVPRGRFYGIGNGDEVGMPGMLINPLVDNTAVDTRYYYNAFSVEAGSSVDLPGPFSVHGSTGYRIRDFDRNEVKSGDLNTFDVYDANGLVGSIDGLQSAFVEVELAFDTLRQPHFYLSKALPATGWYFAARSGYVKGFDKDPSDFVRWGLDARRYLDLYGGDRILVLRAQVDGVTGSVAEIPFIDLPRLGGGVTLRGYPQDRFRDRRAGVASAEYQWSVDRSIAAFLFTDVGRVWRNLDDLQEGDFRVGFGGGLQLHSLKNYLARIVISGSKDKDFFFLFSFDPLFANRRGAGEDQ